MHQKLFFLRNNRQTLRSRILVSVLLIFFLSGSDYARDSDNCPENCLIETGIASWYGSRFNDQCTASGEAFDREAYTAAHRTLPFNTLVKVENKRNGRSVIVRINDRGPFVSGRIIDISRNAARDLGMVSAGVAQVNLYLVEESDDPDSTQLPACR